MKKIRPYENLNREFKKIINTRKRINKNLKYKNDIEKAYEGLFLYSVTLFENYIENVFIGLLKKKYKIKKRNGIKLNDDLFFSNKITDKKIKKLILGEKPGEYLDWLPYDSKTIPRSKKFFYDGKPFSNLGTSSNSTLNEIIKLRNYIAHKSLESKNKLQKIHNFKILSILYLFNKNHSHSNNFFDFYIIELNSISGKIQKYLYE